VVIKIHPAGPTLLYRVSRLLRVQEVALANTFDSIFAGSNKLLWIVRILFLFMVVSIAGDLFIFAMDSTTPDRTATPGFIVGIVACGLTIAICIGVMSLDAFTRNKEITTLSAIYFGLLLGFLIGNLFWYALQPLVASYLTMMELEKSRVANALQLLINLFSCFVAVSTLLQTKDEFRFIIPYVEFSKQLKGSKPLVLDTSVIIDGRIADICETGIIDTKLIVPRFVLQELQGIADSSDKIRRNRGRRGLDVLKKLQTNAKVELIMHEGNLPELRDVQKVDERLVVLAKALSARVVTNDFNLNKISQLQGVEVINLNELSNALKLVALPGEVLHVKVAKIGDQPGQGVGYLDDGTMVVIEHGRNSLGQEVAITVTSVLQTPAGRMVFGRIGGTGEFAALPAGK
jgi:uncharacterized protein YacL